MNVNLRPGRPEDAAECGRICYEAFKAISSEHNFAPDFPSVEVATGVMQSLLTHPKFYSVIAELDGRIVGSNFVDERSTIAGLGPITLDPAVQNRTLGHLLMDDILERVRQRGFPGGRGVQAAYHNRTMALYTKMGFVAREPLSCLQGTPPRVEIPGYRVRPATEEDLEACNRVCYAVHGHDRSGELADGIAQKTATVVEHDGRLTGYASSLAFFGHAVAETNTDLKALIGAAKEFGGPGILVPIRNHELFRWCLEGGLRVVQPMTLITIGMYNEPAGAYLPAALY